ncbi:MAG: hypothetical protein K6C08_08435, partial [Oscillospiraceae bacterium]|nr:hypothetical protein [Oscillospiraceae bacterium]
MIKTMKFRSICAVLLILAIILSMFPTTVIRANSDSQEKTEATYFTLKIGSKSAILRMQIGDTCQLQLVESSKEDEDTSISNNESVAASE